MENRLLSDIILSEEECALANSIRVWMLCDDFDRDEDSHVRSVKRQWMYRWMDLFMPDEPRYSGLKDFSQHTLLEKVRQIPTKLRGGALLVELLSFTPYVLLANGPLSGAGEDTLVKRLKNCKLGDEARLGVLGLVSHSLGFSQDYPRQLLKCFKDAAFALQGGWTRVVAYGMGGGLALAVGGAAAATGIGAAIGAAMGLKGAAAVAAGLAFLGGGSLASGGLGMAGGFAVIVMSGGALGASAGVGTLGIIDALTQATVIHEGAKLRVILDEVVVKHQGDVRLHQEVLRNQRRLIGELDGRIDVLALELGRLKAQQSQDKVRIEENEKKLKELEGIVEILMKSNKAGRETFVKHSLAVGPGTNDEPK